MRLVRKKWIYAVIAVAAVGAVAIFLSGRSDDVGNSGIESLERPGETLRAQSVEVWRFGPNGRRQWEFCADSVVVGEQTTYGGISDGKLYTDDGYVTFQADEVVHDESTGDIAICGNVVLSDSKGGRLSTTRILWDGDQSVMTCPEPVLLESGDTKVLGDWMVGNMDTGEFEIAGGVKVIFGSGGLLTAQRVVYNTNDGSVGFEGFRYDDSM